VQRLGDVLLHIYDYPFEAAIYLPAVPSYYPDTPCVVGGGLGDPASFHQTCLDNGFANWLNVAVVSDTCDEVPDKTVPALIAAFNADCKQDGWLQKMMNYRQSEAKGMSGQ
jgi:hypothetical protein